MKIFASFFKPPPDLLHPLAINPQIALAKTRGGTEVDDLMGIVEIKFNVIDKTEETRAKFSVNVIGFNRDQCDAR